MKYKLSNHAAQQLKARGIMRQLDELLYAPQQIIKENDVLVHQSQINDYLYRILINSSTGVIVTGYRTSKIDKYWKHEN